MKISIKNMVCNRCISAVENIFDEMKFQVSQIQLGEIETERALTEKELELLNSKLKTSGFEILEDAAKKQIEKRPSLIKYWRKTQKCLKT